MSLVNASLIAERRRAMLEGLSSLHKNVPEHAKFKPSRNVSVRGLVIDRYKNTKNEKVRTDIWVAIPDPTACYKESGPIKDKDKIIAEVDKELRVLSVTVRESDSYLANIEEYKSKNYDVQLTFTTQLVIEPSSVVKLTFDTNVDEIQMNSFVNVWFSASAWIRKCPGSLARGADPVVRAARFVNGEDISVLKEAVDDELVELFKANPQLCSTQLPRFDQLARNEKWDPFGMRKKSETVFFEPLAADAMSDFAMHFAFADAEGQGCSSQAKIDETSDMPYAYLPQNENDRDKSMPALRMQINHFQWPNNDAFDRGQRELIQIAGSVWDTAIFGIADRVAWPLLAPRIIDGVDMILPFRVDFERSSNSPINKHPDQQEARAQYFARVLTPIVSMAPFLLREGVPVSHRFVAEAVAEQACFFGKPVTLHKKLTNPIVRTISEMTPTLASAFMTSDASKRGVFRVLTQTKFNRRQAEFVAKFAAEYEGKITGPALEALLYVDWANDAEEFRTYMYGNDASADDAEINYADEHPLMKNNIPPNVSMRDNVSGKIFYYIFWIDIELLGGIDASKSGLLLTAAPEEPKTPSKPANGTPKVPGAPKKKRSAAEMSSTGSDDDGTIEEDDDDDEASVSERTRSKTARKGEE